MRQDLAEENQRRWNLLSLPHHPRRYGRLVVQDAGWADYFAPASAVANFLPAKFRFLFLLPQAAAM
jgi:hypothetical protein